jgi:hypothetical protein
MLPRAVLGALIGGAVGFEIYISATVYRFFFGGGHGNFELFWTVFWMTVGGGAGVIGCLYGERVGRRARALVAFFMVGLLGGYAGALASLEIRPFLMRIHHSRWYHYCSEEWIWLGFFTSGLYGAWRATVASRDASLDVGTLRPCSRLCARFLLAASNVVLAIVSCCILGWLMLLAAGTVAVLMGSRGHVFRFGVAMGFWSLPVSAIMGTGIGLEAYRRTNRGCVGNLPRLKDNLPGAIMRACLGLVAGAILAIYALTWFFVDPLRAFFGLSYESFVVSLAAVGGGLSGALAGFQVGRYEGLSKRTLSFALCGVIGGTLPGLLLAGMCLYFDRNLEHVEYWQVALTFGGGISGGALFGLHFAAARPASDADTLLIPTSGPRQSIDSMARTLTRETHVPRSPES